MSKPTTAAPDRFSIQGRGPHEEPDVWEVRDALMMVVIATYLTQEQAVARADWLNARERDRTRRSGS